MLYIDNKLNGLKSKYPKYVNFLKNYFVKNKYIYFKNGNMNYSLTIQNHWKIIQY